MNDLLERYAEVAGRRAVHELQVLAAPLRGARVVHVNSTREGGGVAEILHKLVPLTEALGIDVRWEVIEGVPDFYRCTKSMHNGLQGTAVDIGDGLLRVYESTNRRNAERLRPALEKAEIVFIHDPQPAPLLEMTPGRTGTWVWRCHIDSSHPHPPVWDALRPWIGGYDASVFSLVDFARPLPNPQFLIPPAIDPFSPKNADLPADRIDAVRKEFDIDPSRPMVLQVSRFDRFKDPIGVVRAYQLAKRAVGGLQLVLAGGTASDDPEGAEVLARVRDAAGDDPDIRVLLLPPDAHEIINALQRAADIVIQKSIREGFGLTVTEGLWKGRPVIGGNVGGIRLQIANGHRGYLVDSVEGAAYRIAGLLLNPSLRNAMADRAREYVRENFLLTRLLRDHLTVVHAVRSGARRVALASPSAPVGEGV